MEVPLWAGPPSSVNLFNKGKDVSVDYNQKTVRTWGADALLLEKTTYFKYRTFQIKEFPKVHSERFFATLPCWQENTAPHLPGPEREKTCPASSCRATLKPTHCT